MIVTAWNNGAHRASGAGYGLKVSEVDRNKYFKKDWKIILIQLPGQEGWTEVNIAKRSFWRKDCGELIKKEIGVWLFQNGLAPWETGDPPKLALESAGQNRFGLSLK